MATYVDDTMAKFRQMKMCHLLADTKEELLEMVARIGVNRKWIQDEGEYTEHFDICLSKRKLAVKAGAKEIKYGSELARLVERKKKQLESRRGLKK